MPLQCLPNTEKKTQIALVCKHCSGCAPPALSPGLTTPPPGAKLTPAPGPLHWLFPCSGCAPTPASAITAPNAGFIHLLVGWRNDTLESAAIEWRDLRRVQFFCVQNQYTNSPWSEGCPVRCGHTTRCSSPLLLGAVQRVAPLPVHSGEHSSALSEPFAKTPARAGSQGSAWEERPQETWELAFRSGLGTGWAVAAKSPAQWLWASEVPGDPGPL